MGDRQAHRIATGLDVKVDVGNPFRVLSVLRERPGQYDAAANFRPPVSRAKLHYINPVPINEIAERWIGKYERHRLKALSDLKRALEGSE